MLHPNIQVLKSYNFYWRQEKDHLNIALEKNIIWNEFEIHNDIEFESHRTKQAVSPPTLGERDPWRTSILTLEQFLAHLGWSDVYKSDIMEWYCNLWPFGIGLMCLAWIVLMWEGFEKK